MKSAKDFFRQYFFSTYDRYFYSILIPSFLVGFVFVTLFQGIVELYNLIQLYIKSNVPLKNILLMLINLLPFLTTITLPLGVPIGYILAMGRLSRDSEIIALRSCGVSTWRIVLPGLVWSVLLTLFALVFNNLVGYPATRNYLQLRVQSEREKPIVQLKNQAFLNVGQYQLKFDRSITFENLEVLLSVQMIDLPRKRTIVAEKGRLYKDPESANNYVIKLQNGSISEIQTVETENGKIEQKMFIASFKYLTVYLPVSVTGWDVGKIPESMTVWELQQLLTSEEKNNPSWVSIYNDKIRLKNEATSLKKELQELSKTIANPSERNLRTQQIRSRLKAIAQEQKALSKREKQLTRTILSRERMSLMEKYSFPAAIIVFALVSVFLGMFLPRGGRNENLGIAIIVMIVYYGAWMGARRLIESQKVDAWFVWLPNIIYLLFGLGIMWKKLRE